MSVVLAILGFVMIFAGLDFVFNDTANDDDCNTVAVGAVIVGSVCMGLAGSHLPW